MSNANKWHLTQNTASSYLSPAVIHALSEIRNNLVHLDENEVKSIERISKSFIDTFEPTNAKSQQAYMLFVRLVENEYVEIIQDRFDSFRKIATITRI